MEDSMVFSESRGSNDGDEAEFRGDENGGGSDDVSFVSLRDDLPAADDNDSRGITYTRGANNDNYSRAGDDDESGDFMFKANSGGGDNSPYNNNSFNYNTGSVSGSYYNRSSSSNNDNDDSKYVNINTYDIGRHSSRFPATERPHHGSDNGIWHLEKLNEKAFKKFMKEVGREPKAGQQKKSKPFLKVSTSMNYATLESKKTVSTRSGNVIKFDKDCIESSSAFIALEDSNQSYKAAPRAYRPKTPSWEKAPDKVDLQKLTIAAAQMTDDVYLPDKYVHKVPDYYSMPSKVVKNLTEMKRKSSTSPLNLARSSSSSSIITGSLAESQNQMYNSILEGGSTIKALFDSNESNVAPMDDAMSKASSMGGNRSKLLEKILNSGGKQKSTPVHKGVGLPARLVTPIDDNVAMKKSVSQQSLGLKGGKLSSSAVVVNPSIDSLMESIELMRKISSLAGSHSAPSLIPPLPEIKNRHHVVSNNYNYNVNVNVSNGKLSNVVWDTVSMNSSDNSETSSLQKNLQNMLHALGNVSSSTMDPSVGIDVDAVFTPLNTDGAIASSLTNALTTESVPIIDNKVVAAGINDDVHLLDHTADSSFGVLSSSNQETGEQSYESRMGDSESTQRQESMNNLLLKKKYSQLSINVSSANPKSMNPKHTSSLAQAQTSSPSAAGVSTAINAAAAAASANTAAIYSVDPEYSDPSQGGLRYQVHQRISGWKMTNVRRKNDLISILDTTHLKHKGKVDVIDKLMPIDDMMDTDHSSTSSIGSGKKFYSADSNFFSNDKERPMSSSYRLVGHDLIAEGVIPVGFMDPEAVSYFKPDELIQGSMAKPANKSQKLMITQSMIEILSKNATSPEGRLRQITSWGNTVGRLALARERTPAQRAKNAFVNRHKDAEKEEDWTAKLRYQDRNDIMQSYTSFKSSGFYSSSGKGSSREGSEVSSFFSGWNQDDRSLRERHVKWYGQENLVSKGDDLSRLLNNPSISDYPKDLVPEEFQQKIGREGVEGECDGEGEGEGESGHVQVGVLEEGSMTDNLSMVGTMTDDLLSIS